MGIDHGLGGKDNKKSQQKREKRAVKNKSIAMKALTGGKKKEVIFNESARVEWLTGFGKRKQERRKYGLAMEVLKRQKQHREGVREQRIAVKEAMMHDKVQLGHSEDEVDEDEEKEEEEEEENDCDEKEDANSRNNNVQVFADPSTVSMFGSTVSVNIDTSFASEVNAGFVSEGDEHSVSISGGGGRNKHLLARKVEPSRLEKALKKVSSQLGNKRSTKKHKDASFEGGKKSKAIKAKMESSKLLFKAMGKGGNSTYKGSKTKRGGGGATVRSKKR